MEDVLDVYTRPYDPLRPQVCLDETSKQLVAETRTPLPTAPGRPARFDYEYERRGVSAVFMLCEPLRGWREVSVSDHRGMVDFAYVIKHLVDEVNPDAEQIVLVMDQLNTHSPGSLYEAFEPAEAKRLADSRVGARRGTDLPARPFPRSALRTGRASWPRIRLSTYSCQVLRYGPGGRRPWRGNRCSPIAVADDRDRCRLEQAHLVLLRPPLPGMAPSQHSHARLRVLMAQPAPHPPPGDGGSSSIPAAQS